MPGKQRSSKLVGDCRQHQITQLVQWCDELAELQALGHFFSMAAIGECVDNSTRGEVANNLWIRGAESLAGQLQQRLQGLHSQLYRELCGLREQSPGAKSCNIATKVR
ncbi:hypothetical protein KFE80_10485 [bacterium SCSIO 12696]|nr:hypothetical protein KFE80_10485 [bacterium SCSIO 12696]